MMSVEIPVMITFREAGRILGVSRPTVYAWIAQGRLTPIAIGDRRFLGRTEVESLRVARALLREPANSRKARPPASAVANRSTSAPPKGGAKSCGDPI